MPKISFLKLAFVLVALLTVVGVGYTGLMIWRDRVSIETKELVSEEKPTQEGQPKIEATSPTGVDSPELDISDWKTYRNEEYGFGIRYPLSWIAIEDWGVNFVPSVVSLISPQTKESTEKPYPRGLPKQAGTISIYHYQNIRQLDRRANSLLSYLAITPEVSNYQKVSFNEYPAFEVWVDGYDRNYAILFEVDGEIYEILVERKFSKEDITTIERKILSTFKLYR